MNHLTRRTLLKGSLGVAGGAMINHRRFQKRGFAQATPSAAGGGYRLIDFGAVPGNVQPVDGGRPGFGGINGINANGVAFGRIAVSDEKFSPALWTLDGDLKRMKSGKYGGTVVGINADGVAAGVLYETPHGADLEDEQETPVIWQDGDLIELPVPAPESEGVRRDIQVIGISDDGVVIGSGNGYWLRWSDGQPEIVPEPEYTSITLNRIIPDGRIFASMYDYSGTETIYTMGEWNGSAIDPVITWPEELGDLAPDSLNGVSISDDGRIFRISRWLTDGYASVLVNNSDVINLDFIESGGSFSGGRVNDRGQLTGLWSAGRFVDYEPAVWLGDGVPTLIADLMPAESGLTVSSIHDINNDGVLVGTAYDAEFVPHFFSLIPE